MITVKFFASLREQLNTSSLEVPFDDGTNTIEKLKQHLIQQNTDWQQALMANNIICACNQEVVNDQQSISAGDEVAFYPPVTGG